jgi:hypothetical protein
MTPQRSIAGRYCQLTERRPCEDGALSPLSARCFRKAPAVYLQHFIERAARGLASLSGDGVVRRARPAQHPRRTGTHILDGARIERDKATPASAPDRRIDQSTMALASEVRGQSLACRITDGGIGIERRVRIRSSKIWEVANAVGEPFDVARFALIATDVAKLPRGDGSRRPLPMSVRPRRNTRRRELHH